MFSITKHSTRLAAMGVYQVDIIYIYILVKRPKKHTQILWRIIYISSGRRNQYILLATEISFDIIGKDDM